MDFFNEIFHNLALLEFYFLNIIYILLYIDFILSIFFQHSNILTRASHHWCLASNIVLVVWGDLDTGSWRVVWSKANDGHTSGSFPFIKWPIEVYLADRCQTIFWTNAGILLIGPLGTNFSEILIEIHIFSFKKMHLKMSSWKWQPICLGPKVLRQVTDIVITSSDNPWPVTVTSRPLTTS